MNPGKEAKAVAKTIISALERNYVQKSNKEKGAWYKIMWTKNQYDFYGLSFPVRRKEDEKVTQQNPNITFFVCVFFNATFSYTLL